MGQFAQEAIGSNLAYVPLSPLLNTTFQMLFQRSQAQQAMAAQDRQQKRALWTQAGTTAATLGTVGIMAGVGGGGGVIPGGSLPSPTEPMPGLDSMGGGAMSNSFTPSPNNW